MSMSYVPIQQRWRKLGPLYRSLTAAAIWFPEMEAFSFSRAEERGYPYRPIPLTPDLVPARYDSCDWRFCRDRPGPAPAFWDYACHSACHWLTSLHAWVAMQALPDRPWRIVTSQKHSTVWDGAEMLWDGNFLALGVSADEAWELASGEPDTEQLPIGELMIYEHPDEALQALEEAMDALAGVAP